MSQIALRLARLGDAPRIAILRATASRLACGPVDRALVSRPMQGVSVRRATPVARTRAWSNPRSASRRRASGTQVTTSTLGNPSTSAIANDSAEPTPRHPENFNRWMA